MRKESSMFLNVNDVCEILDCSKSFSYRTIRELNTQLKNQGFITMAGRVSRTFFEEKFHGIKQ